MRKHQVTFQFISEPTDVNFGGKVHGGQVMKWIDQTAFTCARIWSEKYCVTVYVGGIRFLKPINIGDVVKIEAYVIHTGRTSIHIAVDVYSREFNNDFEKKTHCVIVFVALNDAGLPTPVSKFVPQTEREIALNDYAIRLKDLRKEINEEMMPYIQDTPPPSR